MIRLTLPLLLFLLFAAACGPSRPEPGTDPVGLVFPSAEGRNLDGAPIRIPGDFTGEPVLLLLGYVQEAQFDADRWLFGLLQADLELRFVEVPTIKGLVPGLIRRTIDNGMRDGIPAEDWGSVVTLYGRQAADIVRLTGNEKPRNVRAMLLDGAGTIRWFHDRGYSAGTLMNLASSLEQLRGSGPSAAGD